MVSRKTIFTTGEVAKICKVAPRVVSKWFDSGRLRGYRIPGSQDRRIPKEYLIRFMKEYGMPLGDLESESNGEAEEKVEGGSVPISRNLHPDAVISFYDVENEIWTCTRAKCTGGVSGKGHNIGEAYQNLEWKEKVQQ